ncbi:MAG: cytidine deaminase [Crocinitomicaceae bacterium]|nr:cytidine deaminase [Crocinitomicaceae bacterium]
MKRSLTLNYEEGENWKDLNEDLHAMIEETITFSKNAYAPYSNFKVSAGLTLENGIKNFGTNVENASYPASICAERTLISHTVANHPNDRIKTMVIYVDKAVGEPVPPCGICRQTILEIELKQKSPIEIILISKEGNYKVFEKSADLLPLYFDGSVL